MKLLVTDIDGTLTSGNSVPGPVREACSRLRGAGWRFMVATGRIWASARPFAEAIGSDLPSIVYDGARIMAKAGGTFCKDWRLPRDTAEEALSLCWNSSLILQVYGDEEVSCRPQDHVTRDFFERLGVKVDPHLTSPRLSYDPFRIILYGEPKEARDVGRKVKEQMGTHLEVTLAGEGFLDILPRGVSKGAALRAFREDSRMDVDFVVAAGDHLNDLDLLGGADLAVTFRDAPREVLGAAHLVLPPASSMGFLDLCRFIEERDTGPVFTSEGMIGRRGYPLHLGVEPS
jgi:Cof subfamily protein (haloacid dehalogenase superfamily)